MTIQPPCAGSEQPDIIEPTIEVGAVVWDEAEYNASRGKIVKITNKTVIVQYRNRISSYPIDCLSVEYVCPYLVLVAGTMETCIHKYA